MAEVNELIKPSDEALDLVQEWLSGSGITGLNHSPSKDWIEIYIPIASAERLLNTKYHVYEHEDGTRLTRTPEWSLPSHLHEHIDTIQPTTSFFRASPESKDSLELLPWVSPTYKKPTDPIISKVCNISSVTPECFMRLYSTYSYSPKATRENKVGFNNYLNETVIRPDAAKFLAKYRPEAVSGARKFKQISIADGPVQDGPLTPDQATTGIGREANLDVQAILGISFPTPVTSYSTGGSPPFKPDINTPTDTNEPYLVWLNYVLSQYDVPQVSLVSLVLCLVTLSLQLLVVVVVAIIIIVY